MIAENAMILDLNDVVLIFRVLLLQVLQNAELHTGLVLVPLLILDDFDGHDLVCLVI